MSFSFVPTTREVLEQIVREPRFRAQTQIPVFAPMEIGLLIGCYALFALSSYLFIAEMLPMPLMLATNGFAIYAVFTPLHDATHRTCSGNRTVNDLLGTLACLLLIPGITTRIYRYLHLEHHRYAGDPKRDPDEIFVAAKPIALPFVLTCIDLVWTFWYLRRWQSRPRNERIEFTFCIAFYAGFHVVGLLSPWALEFFLLWMIPQRIGLFTVGWFFAHIQHPRDVQWEDAPFQTTVRVMTNPLFRWLLLGQSKHHIHHLAPSVPYYRYHHVWNLGRHLFEKQHISTCTLWSPSHDINLPIVTQATWLRARVASVTNVAEDIRAYEFVPDNEQDWPVLAAGAHINVEMKSGLVRQYSLCNSPEERNRYRVAVRHDPQGRGGSDYLHTHIKMGDVLNIGEPRNNFPLNESFSEYLLIAGGIGVTPLLSMAHHLHATNQQFELRQCARNAACLAFRDESSELPFTDSITTWLDDATFDRRFDVKRVVGTYGPGCAIYLCGPTGFMRYVTDVAKDAGWPDEAIFSETFVPPAADATENTPFEVEIASSGQIINVAAYEFLIDVLHANGVAVMCSCTQGICGSCMTPVLSGVPEHRDAVMTEAERAANKQMTVCVSRAKSKRLVLDL